MEEKQQKQDFGRIAPADVSLSHGKQPDDSPVPGRNGLSSRQTGLGLALFVIAAIVIFFLPDWIPPKPLPSDQSATTVTSSREAAVPGTSGGGVQQAVAPWSQAQQARLRQDSQEILAQMLEKHEALQQHGVQQWAGEEYRQAMQLADSGDGAYRSQDFQQAVDWYQQALAAFQHLLDRVNPLYEEMMQKGAAALAAHRTEEALRAFGLALDIRPADTLATKGLSRASTLDEVMRLITAGNKYRTRNELAKARQSYQQALALDSEASVAQRKLAETNQRIGEENFNAVMSEAYMALDSEQLEKAEQAFARAVKLMPKASAASTALAETRNRITSERISDLLQKAGELEIGEQWVEATGQYDAALSLDENLLSARQGKQRAADRAEFDQQLKYALARPARLANQAVYTEVQQLNQLATRSASCLLCCVSPGYLSGYNSCRMVQPMSPCIRRRFWDGLPILSSP